jgi:Holliday junction resolvase RusA-like endonuclease
MPRRLSDEAVNNLFDSVGSPFDLPNKELDRDLNRKDEIEDDNRRNDLTTVEMTLDEISFVVYGEPLASNNLKFNRKTGYAYRPKEHKQRIYSVREYAERELGKYGITAFPLFKKGTPLYLRAKLIFPYRRQDYRTGRHEDQLKPNAPKYVTVKKDIDNILKPLKDGMTSVIYFDDSQVCRYEQIEKVYGITPCTEVTVGVLND